MATLTFKSFLVVKKNLYVGYNRQSKIVKEVTFFNQKNKMINM